MLEKELAAEYVMRLFHARTSAHVHHLQTKSYAAHKAMNEFYDGVISLADDFAEQAQGIVGILPYPALAYANTPDFMNELKALRTWIDEQRAEMTDESSLQNTVDEAVSLIDSTLYKLRFLS